MLIGILAVLSMIAIAKAIYWKLCFQGVLLYIAECGNPLPNTTLQGIQDAVPDSTGQDDDRAAAYRSYLRMDL